jgi:SAM-dependent methyltransferase
MIDQYHYPGEELGLFEQAGTWKRYFAARLRPHIRGRVLEVGAGTGDTSPYLFTTASSSWTSLEPDPRLYAAALKKKAGGGFQFPLELKNTSLEQLPGEARFDTILYIDVLEHIDNDREEVRQAIRHLAPGGTLIVLSPAWQSLYSPFDKAIGHCRRYTKITLRKLFEQTPVREKELYYLETAGMLLLLLNKYLFRRSYPQRGHLRVWQQFFIPVSKLIDKLLFYRLGKSIIGIWTLPPSPHEESNT